MKKRIVFTFFSIFIFLSSFYGEVTIAFFDPILTYCTKDERNWIPVVLNNALMSQINRYSNLVPFDQATLSTTLEQIKKSEDAAYDEQFIIEAGKLIDASYLCYVKVIKISSLFNVYFNIINATTGVPIATYEDDGTKEDLYKAGSESIVNKAVLKMLEDDLGGIHSLKNISELKKTMGWKDSDGSPVSRSEEFMVAFLPPALINCDDVWMRELLPGRLVNSFFSYSRIMPLDQGVEKSAIDKIKLSESGIYDESTITEAGKLVSAPYYCYAAITQIKRGVYQAYFNLIDTKTGKPVAIYHTSCSADWIRGIKGFNVVDLAVYTMLTENLENKYNNEYTASLGRQLQKQLKKKDIQKSKDISSNRYSVYVDKVYIPPKERKEKEGANTNDKNTVPMNREEALRKRFGY